MLPIRAVRNILVLGIGLSTLRFVYFLWDVWKILTFCDVGAGRGSKGLLLGDFRGKFLKYVMAVWDACNSEFTHWTF